MKSFLLASLTAVCAAVSAEALPVDEPLRVVATIPDLQDIARTIGGDEVEVKCLSRGTEDIHSVPLRPSSLVAVNKADLFLQVGLALEHAYVPGLLLRAKNFDLNPGEKGFVNISDDWEPIQVPPRVSRFDSADVHPLGNPHINFDRRFGRHAAAKILEGLIRVRPNAEKGFRERYEAYLEELAVAEARWERVGAKLKGKCAVSFHRSFDYFLADYGMELTTTLEPKPGVPPNARHLAGVIQLCEEKEIGAILTERWSNAKAVQYVSEQTGCPVCELPGMVGGAKGADTWIGFQDIVLERLLAIYGLAGGEGDG